MPGRHYDGRFWAQGETVFHSLRTEYRNTARKARKQIAFWTDLAQRTPGDRAQEKAAREIAALKEYAARYERLADEMTEQIEAREREAVG